MFCFFVSIHKPAKSRKINLDKLRFSPITSRISSNVWRTISEIFSSSLLSSLSFRFRRTRRKRSVRLRSTYFTDEQSDHEVSENRSSTGKWRSSKASGIAVMSKCCRGIMNNQNKMSWEGNWTLENKRWACRWKRPAHSDFGVGARDDGRKRTSWTESLTGSAAMIEAEFSNGISITAGKQRFCGSIV